MRYIIVSFWLMHLVESVRQPRARCSTCNPASNISQGEKHDDYDVGNTTSKSDFRISLGVRSQHFADHTETSTSYLVPSSFISGSFREEKNMISMEDLLLIMVASLLLGAMISSLILVCYFFRQRKFEFQGRDKGSRESAGEDMIHESTESDNGRDRGSRRSPRHETMPDSTDSDNSNEEQWCLKDGKSGRPEENSGGALSRTLARGKEKRGADSSDKYKFGDFTRGAIASLKKKTKGSEDVKQSDSVHFPIDVSHQRIAQTAKEQASSTSFERC